jgi:hypothetical protein
MKHFFACALLATSIAALSACTTMPDGSKVLGRPGSPAWRMSTTAEQQWNYIYGMCEQYGYKKGSENWPECVQKTMSDLGLQPAFGN